MGIGGGVRIRKRSSGGVIRSMLAASAKKSNTSSRGSGRLMDVSKTCVGTLLIVVGAVAPPTVGRFRRLYVGWRRVPGKGSPSVASTPRNDPLALEKPLQDTS